MYVRRTILPRSCWGAENSGRISDTFSESKGGISTNAGRSTTRHVGSTRNAAARAKRIHSSAAYSKNLNINDPSTGYPSDWDKIRRQVYERDWYQCANCRRRGVELHAHHIVPLSMGGTNNLTNLKTLCKDCHEKLHPHMKS